jgi:UTP--glucose-1-phosphate uridylyltransferase
MSVSLSVFPGTLAILPAAGYGTRLRPLTDVTAKELLPLGRRPVFDWILAELEDAGLRRAVGVVSPAKESVFRGRYGSRFGGMDLEWVVQSEMRGLGDAVSCTQAVAAGAESLLVALADAVVEEPVSGGLTGRLLRAADPIAIAVQEVSPERVSRYGIVNPVEIGNGLSFRIRGIVEKPSVDVAPSRFAVCARYRLPTTIFDALKAIHVNTGSEKALTPAIDLLISQGVTASACPLLPGEARHDIGGFDTYFRAFTTFALHDEEHGAALRTTLGDALK